MSDPDTPTEMIDFGPLGDAYPWERSLGAQQIDDGRAQFRVWAPRAPAPPCRSCDGEEYVIEPRGLRRV